MHKLLVVTALLWAAGSVVSAQTVFLSPDVPTTPDGPATFVPWEIVRHESGALAPYGSVALVPDDPAVDALHRMDQPGNWLFSIGAHNDLAGLVGPTADPRDVIRFDAGAYSIFFRGGALINPGERLPAGTILDALYLEGGDNGNLVISFDAPTTILGTTYAPSALVRYRRLGPAPTDWIFNGLVIDFATAAITYFPRAANVIGADEVGSGWIFVVDIPTDLAPSAGPTTYLPGQIVFFDPGPGVFSLFDDLQVSGGPGWPVSSLVDALSCQANPGAIDPASTQITLDKAGADIVLFWGPGCSGGAEDYGIYEGTLTSLVAATYDHQQITCLDTLPPFQEQVTPSAVDTYYLLVPYNSKVEGSYGKDSTGTERPQAVLPAVNRCILDQDLTPCP